MPFEKGKSGNPAGRWGKGESGNPGGRPKENQELKELAREHTKFVIERLFHWAQSDDGRVSVAACNALLDRGYGKPMQALEHSGADVEPLTHILTVELVTAKPEPEVVTARPSKAQVMQRGLPGANGSAGAFN